MTATNMQISIHSYKREISKLNSFKVAKGAYNLGCKLLLVVLYYVYNTTNDGKGDTMLIEIDFNSDEALYVQLQNQIIMGIATATIQEGESLPSVRQLADTVGINMHTVNKAYSILKQEGFIQLDRRRGAVIAIDADKAKAYAEVKRALRIALAKGSLKNVSREEVHEMVDELFDEYGGKE